MSAIVMGAVMSRGPKKVTPRFVLVAIADNADEYGFAYLSMETIADKACCSMRNASRLVDALEREGWLAVRRHVFSGRSNVYFVNIEKLGVEVSEKSRKSRMHYEVERMLDAKKPHAKLSDGNAPEAVETQVEPSANSQGVQRPKTAMPPAKSGVAILKNRCEPSLNQTTPPTPPDGGSSKSAFVSANPTAKLTTLLSILTPDAARNVGASEPAETPKREQRGDPMVLARCFLDELHDEFARVFGADHAIAKNRPGWEDALSAWRRCFDHVRVAEVNVAEGDGSGYVVVLETPRPRELSDGLAKYKAKVSAAMNKTFGREVRLVPRMAV